VTSTKILGLDPGKSTGWGRITVENRQISLGEFGVSKDMTLSDIAHHFADVDIVVYEGFWIDPKLAQAGFLNYDEMLAPQVIGTIKTLAKQHGIQHVEKQNASLKPPAYGFAGMKYVRGKKNMHAQDAIAHAVYYAVKKLQARPVRASV